MTLPRRKSTNPPANSCWELPIRASWPRNWAGTIRYLLCCPEDRRCLFAPVIAVRPDRLRRVACPHEIAVIEPPYGLTDEMSSPCHLSFERTVRRLPTDEPNTQDNAQISHFSVYRLALPPIRKGCGFSASMGSPAWSGRGRAGYCGGIFMHIATTGLLAGTGLRQVAERSVGMTAALRRAPQ